MNTDNSNFFEPLKSRPSSASLTNRNTVGRSNNGSSYNTDNAHNTSTNSGGDLSADESIKCLDTICKIDLTLSPVEIDRKLTNFVQKCDKDVLCSTVICNKTFLNIWKSILPISLWENQISNVARILDIFIANPSKYKEGILNFTDYTRENRVFLETLINYLQVSSIKDPTILKTLHCLALLLNSYIILKDFYESAMTELLFELLIELSQCDLPNVEALLLLQTEIDTIRTIIIEEVVPLRLKIYDFLNSKTLKDYPRLQGQLDETIKTIIPANVDLKRKFDKTNNEYQDLAHLSLLQVNNLMTFLKNTNLQFREAFHEHLLFNDMPFPIFNVLFKVSDEIRKFYYIHKCELEERPCLATFILNKEFLLFEIMNVELRMWIESDAKTRDDIESLSSLITVILRKVDRIIYDAMKLEPTTSFTKLVLSFLKSVHYNTARQYQLDQIKESHRRIWSKQFYEFDELLKDHVFEYVKHQRLLQLQKGIWAYADNPLDTSIKNIPMYFLILSDNQANLLAREFPFKTDEPPYVHANNIVTPSSSSSSNNNSNNSSGSNTSLLMKPTVTIPLKSIATFESEDVTSKSPSIADQQHLVNMMERKFFCEISLLSKGRKILLNFYLDSVEAKYVWYDGLQFLAPLGKYDNITATSKKQIENLFVLRRNIQFLNLKDDMLSIDLEEKGARTAHDDEEDEDVYDLDNLKSLTTNFFYD